MVRAFRTTSILSSISTLPPVTFSRPSVYIYLSLYMFSLMKFSFLPPLHTMVSQIPCVTSHLFCLKPFFHHYLTSSSFHQDSYVHLSLPFTISTYATSNQLPKYLFTYKSLTSTPPTTSHFFAAVFWRGCFRESEITTPHLNGYLWHLWCEVWLYWQTVSISGICNFLSCLFSFYSHTPST